MTACEPVRTKEGSVWCRSHGQDRWSIQIFSGKDKDVGGFAIRCVGGLESWIAISGMQLKEVEKP